MAKAKFKLGTMVKYKGSDEADYLAEVVGVITRTDSYQYIVAAEDTETTISESDVTGAYRALTNVRKAPRKRKPKAVEDAGSQAAAAAEKTA